MSGQRRITNRDVQAARRALARTEKRIHTHGQGVVAQAAWDEAIEQALESPDILALHATLSEPIAAEPLSRDQRRETAHQRVVQFIQDCQQSG